MIYMQCIIERRLVKTGQVTHSSHGSNSNDAEPGRTKIEGKALNCVKESTFPLVYNS